jgi:hypothetical protein
VYGDDWTHDSKGLLVSNGEAHDVLVDVVQQGIGIEA